MPQAKPPGSAIAAADSGAPEPSLLLSPPMSIALARDDALLLLLLLLLLQLLGVSDMTRPSMATPSGLSMFGADGRLMEPGGFLEGKKWERERRTTGEKGGEPSASFLIHKKRRP